MRYDKLTGVTLMATLGVTASADAAPKQPASNAPNVIIINLDDAGYGDFPCYGGRGYDMPNVDAMASHGMRFTQMLCAQPISGASRMGLLTGCYPNRLGFYGAPGPSTKMGIAAEEMTIAEVLKQRGYATAAYGKWHLGNRHQFLPLQNGFDEFYGLPYSNDMWPFHPETPDGYPPIPLIEGNNVIGYNTDQTRLTTDYTDHAVAFIAAHHKEPFFVYLAHSMPHVPLAVSDKFKGKSRQGLFGDVMMEIDWSVGQIMEALKKYGLENNTLLVLTSDNGPWTNYGNHAGSAGGLRQGKATTFEGGNRVPCIMRWPGVIPAGRMCNRLASHIDILPTVADVCSAPLPGLTIDGVSLLPLLKGVPDANPRKAFVYWYNRNDLEAVTDGDYKLVFPHQYRDYGAFPPGNDGKPGKTGVAKLEAPELYDLRRDPGERYDVKALYPERVARLEAVADSMRNVLGDNLKGVTGAQVRPVGMAAE